jgi:GDP-L-fucose synthase
MEKSSKIYVAGHNGMVGSAITRNLLASGFENLVFTPHPPYDLSNQKTVEEFFSSEKPEYVFLAAARVGGIVANNRYRAQFIYDNLMIQNNIIHITVISVVSKNFFFLGVPVSIRRIAPNPSGKITFLLMNWNIQMSLMPLPK